MICKKINCDEYLVTYNKYIDPFNYKELTNILNKIYNKFLKRKNIKGIYIFDIYMNYNSPKILIKTINYHINYIEIKLLVHFDGLVIYKISNYDLLKKIKHKKIYYYKNNYYIELTKDLKYKETLLLEEISECIYGKKALDIVYESVQLCEKM